MKRAWIGMPRWVRIALISLGATAAMLAVAALATWGYLHPAVTRTDGVVYGQRHGQDLTLDVLLPEEPNGLGVAFMVSGGWISMPAGGVPIWVMAPLLRRGYSVFAVCHVSQPESTVMEIIEDVNRGLRFIRHHADRYGIDPNRIGVTGASAGGHLSLMLATLGGPGPTDASDPVARESSAVQAVAIFFPVVDLLNLGASTENPGDGGPPVSFVAAFGPNATNRAAWKQIGRATSPIYHVTKELPPVLIVHGDADTLTPLEQSESFRDGARKVGRDVELIVHPGGEHGWLTMPWDIRGFADWFDRHLLGEDKLVE